MPITQIPFQDPVAPEKTQPEQLGLYDREGWETAYKELDDDARVPHLLIQLQDDLARSRRREAAWISIIVHLVLIILLVNSERLAKWFPWMHSVVAVARPLSAHKDVTFLDLPPDLQKAPHRATNVLSDKDRIAMSRHPELDPKELRRILTPPPGRSGMNAPAAGQQSQSPPQVSQSPPQQRPQPPPQETQQTAQLQLPKPDIANEFSKYAGSMSAGAAVQQAARAAAAGRASGAAGDGGDFGLGTGARGRQVGNLEILSDTQGVDFGPYLQRVLQDVRQNWYMLIPESAQMKHGNLVIEFAIMKDGSVQGLRIVMSSNDVALDRPAYGSIKGSDPFPPLPSEFKGQYLALRFRFFYNPTKEEME